jgi:hypothetical protein
LAIDGKIGRRQQTRFTREFAETELRGNDADPGISGSAVHAMHDKRAACGGLFRSVAKDPDLTQEKSDGWLTASEWQPARPISRVGQEFFGCGVGLRHRKIRWTLPFLTSTVLHPTVRIGLALISQGTIKKVLKLFFASRV